MRQHHHVVRAMDLLPRCWVQVLHYSLAGFLLMVQSNLVNMDAEGAIEGVYIKGVSAPGGVLWISSYRDDQRIFWGYPKLLFLFLLLYHLKFLWLGNSAWIFLGFVAGPRDFSGFWFLPPFNHPCHLKSGVLPPPLKFCRHSNCKISV